MPSMPSKGPITLQADPQKVASVPELRLRVRNETVDLGGSSWRVARINATDCAPWAAAMQPACLATLAGGADCVITVRPDPDAVAGCIAMDEVMQRNLHLCPGETYSFSVFTPPPNEPFDLAEVEAEVWLLRDRQGAWRQPRQYATHSVDVDAQQLAKAFAKHCFRSVLAVNELVTLEFDGCVLACRVTAAHTLDAAAREEAIGYHCFRGIMMPDTEVFLWAPAEQTGQLPGRVAASLHDADSRLAQLSIAEQDGCASHMAANEEGHDGQNAASCPAPGEAQSVPDLSHGTARRPPLHLVNARRRPSEGGAGRNTVNVYTRDGEWFPVKRKLLRHCIALTKVVRSEEESEVDVTIDVDTDIFDRVLIYLEAAALGRPKPVFAAHLTQALLAAAVALGLRSLEDDMRAKLGHMESRLQVYSLAEVFQRNATGACWLILDGMLLDVKRWLPEHPGGSTIIPRQGLNHDCARFFEVYHVSRESFLYLSEFYIGEIAPEDRPLVPVLEEPSPEFLQQLREYTGFRMKLGAAKAFKSF